MWRYLNAIRDDVVYCVEIIDAAARWRGGAGSSPLHRVTG